MVSPILASRQPLSSCCQPQITQFSVATNANNTPLLKPQSLGQDTAQFGGCPLCAAAAAGALLSSGAGGTGAFLALNHFLDYVGLNSHSEKAKNGPTLITKGIRRFFESTGLKELFTTTKP